MSYLTSILSNIDPSAGNQSNSPVTKPAQPPKTTKPTLGQAAGQNGAVLAQPVKRKAETQPDSTQAKVQRKDAPAPLDRVSGTSRPGTASDPAKTKVTTPTSSIPYRGTAALAKPKPSNSIPKQPVAVAKTTPAVPRASDASAQSTVKASSGTTPSASTSKAAAAPRPGSYAAMLAKAKEAQQNKVATPPVKVEPTKILTKKERMKLKQEAKTATKTGPSKARNAVFGGLSKSSGAAPGKASDTDKEKKKSADLGYTGTMRPKQSVEPAYKGTARSAVGQKPTNGYDQGRSSSLPAKSKRKDTSRYDGYANWSDLDDVDDEEEDYESDASSDMEGGMWDVEKEERLALVAAKREDAEALAEENELKRQKEERKRKLAAMAANTKRRY